MEDRNVSPNNELFHYGVKGMKWGVRKDQNRTANGRLTSSGVSKRKEQSDKIYNAAKKGVKVTSQVMAKLGVVYLADQVLFDGVGTDAAKFAMKEIGRMAVTPILKSRD